MLHDSGPAAHSLSNHLRSPDRGNSLTMATRALGYGRISSSKSRLYNSSLPTFSPSTMPPRFILLRNSSLLALNRAEITAFQARLKKQIKAVNANPDPTEGQKYITSKRLFAHLDFCEAKLGILEARE